MLATKPNKTFRFYVPVRKLARRNLCSVGFSTRSMMSYHLAAVAAAAAAVVVVVVVASAVVVVAVAAAVVSGGSTTLSTPSPS